MTYIFIIILSAPNIQTSTTVVSEVELKPGGRMIAVTNDNVVEYIHRVADFRYENNSVKVVYPGSTLTIRMYSRSA